MISPARVGRYMQQGRTMIELIIAMAIGLVIMAGVGALYLSSSGVSRVAHQAGTAQDLGRVAMFVIGEAVKVAGYGEHVGAGTTGDQTLFFGQAIRGCSGSRFTDPFGTPPDYTCTGVAPGDQVMVRFQGAHSANVNSGPETDAIALRDCLGASNLNQDTVVPPGRASSGLTVRIVQSMFNLNPAGTILMCTGNGNPGVPAQLILNVIDFAVFYRFDEDGYNSEIAGGMARYPMMGGSIRSAAFINGLVGPVDPWRHVTAALVCITIASADMGTSIQSVNANATRCPRTPAEALTGRTQVETSTDGRMRRTFIQLFSLRTRAAPTPAMEP